MPLTVFFRISMLDPTAHMWCTLLADASVAASPVGTSPHLPGFKVVSSPFRSVEAQPNRDLRQAHVSLVPMQRAPLPSPPHPALPCPQWPAAAGGPWHEPNPFGGPCPAPLSAAAPAAAQACRPWGGGRGGRGRGRRGGGDYAIGRLECLRLPAAPGAGDAGEGGQAAGRRPQRSV